MRRGRLEGSEHPPDLQRSLLCPSAAARGLNQRVRTSDLLNLISGGRIALEKPPARSLLPPPRTSGWGAVTGLISGASGRCESAPFKGERGKLTRSARRFGLG